MKPKIASTPTSHFSMTAASETFKTTASALANGIRADIISCTLAPGARLRIKDLCERYDSGAIPVREALSRLASSGFVIAEDQKGFRVASVSAKELLDITNTRVHIECEALRLAITNGGLDWEEKLAGAYHRLSRLPMLGEGQGVEPEWERAHAAFHGALISASGSKWLNALAELLRDQTTRYRHLSVANLHAETSAESADGLARDVADEHLQLLNAVLARDVALATKLLAEHLWATSNLVLKLTQPEIGKALR